MLAKKNRLITEDFFSSNQKNVRAEHIGARFWPNSLKRNRFAVVISSKAESSSVARHRLKRKVFRLVSEWPILELDIVLSFSKKLQPKAEESLPLEISSLLDKILKTNPPSRKND